MEKNEQQIEEILENFKNMLMSAVEEEPDTENEEVEEHLPDWAFNALLEAIKIIFEKSVTVDEGIEALDRIQAALRFEN